MRSNAAILGTLLAISMLVNVAVLMRTGHGPNVREGASPSGSRTMEPVTAQAGTTDLVPVLAELRALRAEVRELKISSGTIIRMETDSSEAPGVAKKPDRDLSPAITGDPKVAELVREQKELQNLWKDLGVLGQLKKQLGEEKHREVVLAATTEYLGLDASRAEAFRWQADLVRHDLQRAQEERQAAYDALKTSGAKKGGANQSREIWNRYNEKRRTAVARLETGLDSGPRHEHFKENLQRWSQFYIGSYASGNVSYSTLR